MAMHHLGKNIQQVTCLLDIETYGIRISPGSFECSSSGTVVCIGIAHTYNHQILVTISQQRIDFIHHVQIVLKGFRTIRHINIVHIKHIETMVCFLSPGPAVTPSCRCYGTFKFRTHLPVELCSHFRGRTDTPFKVRRQKRKHKFREAEACLHSILHVIIVGISFQTSNSFVGSTYFGCKGFRSPEQIPMGISH